MTIRTTGFVFVFSILLLLTFQPAWLYNTYHLEEERVQADINVCFQKAIKEELIIRLKQLDENLKNIIIHDDSDVYKEDKTESTVVAIDIEEGLGDVLPQYMLSHAGIDFDLRILEKLFLSKSNYQLDYLICYRDSANQLLDSIGSASFQDIRNVFSSDSLPVINKSYVYILSEISMPIVLKRMVDITAASFLVFFVILFSLIYITRYAYNQYRLNKLREDFSQALIHDIKSPLNTIYISLTNYKIGLYEKNPDFGIQSTIRALDQVLNIQALVDRLLTIARLEDKKMKVLRTEIDLPAMIQKQMERYSFSTRKEVVFETSYTLHSTPIYADQALLENAIGNLIDNAIKYSGESVTIRIRCDVSDKKLYLRVEDNGLGISEDDQKKIFEKFERGAAVYRKGAKGFGLGLNYVRQVAIAHRGTVALSSAKGHGSEFVLVIPLFLDALGKNSGFSQA